MPAVLATFLPETLALAAAALLMSCGPSVQGLHESNVRFEHCYRLDLDSSITPTHRAACWREWNQTYTLGQTDDRIDYARRRATLSATETEGPRLDLDAGGADAASSMTAHAAPASSTQPMPDPPAPSASTAAVAPPPPAFACTSDCLSSLHACAAPCADGAGPACKACEPDYKKCMRRCFK